MREVDPKSGGVRFRPATFYLVWLGPIEDGFVGAIPKRSLDSSQDWTSPVIVQNIARSAGSSGILNVFIAERDSTYDQHTGVALHYRPIMPLIKMHVCAGGVKVSRKSIPSKAVVPTLATWPWLAMGLQAVRYSPKMESSDLIIPDQCEEYEKYETFEKSVFSISTDLEIVYCALLARGEHDDVLITGSHTDTSMKALAFCAMRACYFIDDLMRHNVCECKMTLSGEDFFKGVWPAPWPAHAVPEGLCRPYPTCAGGMSSVGCTLERGLCARH